MFGGLGALFGAGAIGLATRAAPTTAPNHVEPKSEASELQPRGSASRRPALMRTPARERLPGAQQPLAIFHAFDQRYADIADYACDLRGQGYSHVQVSPAQKSNPDSAWWARYQPIDYGVIDGRGTEAELSDLIQIAHDCGLNVIADVVFNHMANVSEFANLDFPGAIGPADFHQPRCSPAYSDGNRGTELRCWLGGDLPDLIQENQSVRSAHRQHIDKLIELGIDGFRFDAAKHMEPDAVRDYVNYINGRRPGGTWNYLEVITDPDTAAEHYNGIAATTDFELYRTMRQAFSKGGDLRALRLPQTVNDARSVTFGQNHDNLRRINPQFAIDPYEDPSDSFLATAYVLARESGTPLVLNWDNVDSPFIPFGVRFRRIMVERGAHGADVKENVLAVIDSRTLLIMERGPEGIAIFNSDAAPFDTAAVDMTLTRLEGCYRELRNNFTIAIERRPDGKKWITRWGTWQRGGIHIEPREALFFARDPWERCL
jgi:alpha-amylase